MKIFKKLIPAILGLMVVVGGIFYLWGWLKLTEVTSTGSAICPIKLPTQRFEWILVNIKTGLTIPVNNNGITFVPPGTWGFKFNENL